LAQRHKIGVSVLVEPTPPNHELLPEIADVSDRTAEAAHAELRKREQDLDRRSRPVSIFDRRDGIGSVHQSDLLPILDSTNSCKRILA